MGRYVTESLTEVLQTLTDVTKGTPHLKKMFSFGHCPNEGGGRGSVSKYQRSKYQ